MVDVSNAEVEGREEDDLLSREMRENVNGHDHCSPNEFFANRTLQAVSILLFGKSLEEQRTTT